MTNIASQAQVERGIRRGVNGLLLGSIFALSLIIIGLIEADAIALLIPLIFGLLLGVGVGIYNSMRAS